MEEEDAGREKDEARLIGAEEEADEEDPPPPPREGNAAVGRPPVDELGVPPPPAALDHAVPLPPAAVAPRFFCKPALLNPGICFALLAFTSAGNGFDRGATGAGPLDRAASSTRAHVEEGF